MAEALRGVLDPSDDEPLADTPSAPVRDAVAVAPPRGLRRVVVVVGMAAGAAAVAFALSRGPSQVASAPSGAASVDPSAELPAPQAVPTTRQATFVGSVRRPALSPDGRQVHYLARDGKDVVLWKKDVATDRADEQLRLFRYSDLEVSPDGKSVLVLGIRSGETEPHGFLVDEAGRAEVLDVPFHTVAWTSDGSALVGLRNSAGRTLRVWPFEGPARDVPLAGDYQWIGSLHTVPGSARILVETASADDEARLFAFDPDGSTAERVDLGRTTWTAVAASRDTLFVLTKPAPSSDLLAFPFDGARVGVPRRLLTGLRADELTVSADGTRIAFTQAHVRSNVWGIESKTGRRVELTRGTRQHDAPRLSPDGSRVAFVRTEETGTLVVMPAAGGPETRLSRPEVEVLAFAWAPEGDKLVALTRQGKDVTTTLFAADAGEPQKSVVSATGASFAAAAEPKGMTPLAWDPGADVLLQQAGNQNFLRVTRRRGRPHRSCPSRADGSSTRDRTSQATWPCFATCRTTRRAPPACGWSPTVRALRAGWRPAGSALPASRTTASTSTWSPRTTSASFSASSD
jgi:Tol biopolymer transport system component